MSNGINSPYGLLTVSSAIGNGGTQKLTPYSIYTLSVGADIANAPATLGQNIFSGDPVCWAGGPAANLATATDGANAANGAAGTIVPFVTGRALSTNAPVLGVFQFCNYYNTNNIWIENSPYWPAAQQVKANTRVVAYINDDPNVICRAQISTSTNDYNKTVYLFANNGQNANLAVTNNIAIATNIPAGYVITQNPGVGNVNTGQSAYYVDGSSITNTGNADALVVNTFLPIKIIGLASAIGGQVGGTPPNSAIIRGLVPGVSMPFVDVFFKFNNHVYGSQGTPSAVWTTA